MNIVTINKNSAKLKIIVSKTRTTHSQTVIANAKKDSAKHKT